MQFSFSLEKNIDTNKPNLQFLIVKCSHLHRAARTFSMLDSPMFPRRFITLGTSICLCFKPQTMPVSLVDYMALKTYSIDAVNKKIIPQLMNGLLHAHSRGITLGKVNPYVVAVHGDHAYFLDNSSSLLQVQSVMLHTFVELDEYSAPELVYNKRISHQSDNYGLGLTWICVAERQLISDWIEEKDPGAVHHHVLGKADAVQKMLLVWDVHARPPIEAVLAEYQKQVKFALPTHQNSGLSAFTEKCLSSPETGFDELLALENFDRNIVELRFLLPMFLAKAAALVDHRPLAFIDGVKDHILALMRLMDRVSRQDQISTKSSEHYLCKVWENDHIPFHGLLLHFIALDAPAGTQYLKDFVTTCLFTLTDQFVLDAYAIDIPHGALVEFLSAVKSMPSAKALSKAEEKMGKFAVLIRDENSARVNELEALLTTKNEEIEKYKTEIDELKETAERYKQITQIVSGKRAREGP
jgi:hypothetical protein